MESDVSEPTFPDIPDPLSTAGPELARLAEPLRRGFSGPDRKQVRRRRAAALLLSLGWLATHLLVFGVRNDLDALPAAYLVSHVGAPLVLGLAAAWLALRPGRVGLGPPRVWAVALTLGGPLSFGLLGAISSSASLPAPDAQPWLSALLCSDLMLVWMSVPLFAAALALRGAFAASAVWRSALVGTSIGLLSGVTINLHCENSEAFHLVVGHGVPVALASLLGAFVVRHWLRA